MKKKICIFIGFLFCLNVFCKSNSSVRKVVWDKNKWVLSSESKKTDNEVLKGIKNDCGEGIYFLYEDKTFKRYLVDENMHKLSDKEFIHVGNFSNGKTIVSGYLEKKYETDRIYDVVTDSVSEPLKNMWAYCAFVDGLGAFSVRNAKGELTAVLLDQNLVNVVNKEFDEFCEYDFKNKIWHFKKNEKDFYFSRDGNEIDK